MTKVTCERCGKEVSLNYTADIRDRYGNQTDEVYCMDCGDYLEAKADHDMNEYYNPADRGEDE
jgi:transcription elongation factor Elf1